VLFWRKFLMRVALFLSALSLILPAVPLSVRAQQGPTIKVESKLVLVDLIALDSHGKPVPDLKKDEIEVLEDGKRMPISFFERRHPTSEELPEDGLAVSRTPQRPDTGEKGVLLIFMVDLPSIPPSDLPRVKEAIESFVRTQCRPQDTLMLAATGVTAVQSPTRNVEEFLTQLKKLPPLEEGSSQLLQFGADLERLLTVAKSVPLSTQDLTRQAIDLGRRYIVQEENRTRNATQSAIALIREISTLPGRKNVLYFSGGYRRRIGISIQDTLLSVLPDARLPGLDSTHLWIRSLLGGQPSVVKLDALLRSVVDEANRAQVSFYAADGRGLTTRVDARLGGFVRYGDQLARDDINQSQSFLREIAEETGGRRFLNTNDLETGIRGAYQDASDHYELGYVPPKGSKPGTLHEISVKVNRPHVTVLHRRDYVEPLQYDVERRSVENAFRFPELFQDFPFEVDTAFKNGNLKVDVYVPVRTLVFRQEGSRHKSELAVHMALFDSSGELYEGKTLFSRTYRIDFSETEFAGLAHIDNLTSSYQEKVKPGSYRLRVVVRQTMASKTAALERRITVP
jgi:VWFA-related protein